MTRTEAIRRPVAASVVTDAHFCKLFSQVWLDATCRLTQPGRIQGSAKRLCLKASEINADPRKRVAGDISPWDWGQIPPVHYNSPLSFSGFAART